MPGGAVLNPSRGTPPGPPSKPEGRNLTHRHVLDEPHAPQLQVNTSPDGEYPDVVFLPDTYFSTMIDIVSGRRYAVNRSELSRGDCWEGSTHLRSKAWQSGSTHPTTCRRTCTSSDVGSEKSVSFFWSARRRTSCSTSSGGMGLRRPTGTPSSKRFLSIGQRSYASGEKKYVSRTEFGDDARNDRTRPRS